MTRKNVLKTDSDQRSTGKADSEVDGYGDAPLDFFKKYADTRDTPDACFTAMNKRQEVNRIWADQGGEWAFEASSLKPRSLDDRHPMPVRVH